MSVRKKKKKKTDRGRSEPRVGCLCLLLRRRQRIKMTECKRASQGRAKESISGERQRSERQINVQTNPALQQKKKKKKKNPLLWLEDFFFSLFGTLIFSQGWKICLVNIKNIYIRGECWNGLQKSRPWNVTVVICDNLFLFHYVSVCGASLLWCLCTLLRGEHSSFKQGRTKTPFSLGFCAAEVYVALHGAPLFAFFSALVCECCSWVFAPVRLLLLLLLGVLERQI